MGTSWFPRFARLSIITRFKRSARGRGPASPAEGGSGYPAVALDEGLVRLLVGANVPDVDERPVHLGGEDGLLVLHRGLPGLLHPADLPPRDVLDALLLRRV